MFGKCIQFNVQPSYFGTPITIRRQICKKIWIRQNIYVYVLRCDFADLKELYFNVFLLCSGRRRIHGKTTGWILIGSTRLFSHFRAVALVVTNVTRGRVTCDAVTRCSAVTDLLGKSHEQFKIFCCTPVMSPTVMEDGTLPYFQMM